MNTSPCKKNGKDCPKRRVGCRDTCAAWAAYQIVLIDIRNDRKKEAEANRRNQQVRTRRYIPGNEGSRIKNERKK